MTCLLMRSDGWTFGHVCQVRRRHRWSWASGSGSNRSSNIWIGNLSIDTRNRCSLGHSNGRTLALNHCTHVCHATMIAITGAAAIVDDYCSRAYNSCGGTCTLCTAPFGLAVPERQRRRLHFGRKAMHPTKVRVLQARESHESISASVFASERMVLVRTLQLPVSWLRELVPRGREPNTSAHRLATFITTAVPSRSVTTWVHGATKGSQEAR